MIGMKVMIAGMASTKSPMITNSRTSNSMIIPASVPAKSAIQAATMSGPRR
jgi:hypothetical protein